MLHVAQFILIYHKQQEQHLILLTLINAYYVTNNVLKLITASEIENFFSIFEKK